MEKKNVTEQTQVKDLSIYHTKFENDPTLFNEFQAIDYVKELKNQGNLDEAIRVGDAFYEQCPNLNGYINHYAYAIYEKYVAIEFQEINKDEKSFFEAVDKICSLTKQERYSPKDATLAKAIFYLTNKKNVDYARLARILDMQDPTLLSKEPYKSKDGKEGESRFERWYRLSVRAAFETKNYERCVELANQALSLAITWHYRNIQWIKYYKACSNLELGHYEDSQRDFLSLQGQIRDVNFLDVLYRINVAMGQDKQANAYLLYDLFQNGYHKDLLPLYEKVAQAAVRSGYEPLMKWSGLLVDKIKQENGEDISNNQLIKYAHMTSSDIYDELMALMISHLNELVERKSGRVIHYNAEKQLGSISVRGKDSLFFRQEDYIYDEEVERRDRVEYTLLPSYDAKKQQATEKAILILTVENDDYTY